MSVRCGIVGLPNAGKSTLLNSLTNANVATENFPYTTTETKIGTVEVPDPRLDKLTEIEKPQKTIPNVIEVIDIAGIAHGASTGEGLGNQFLDAIRNVDAIIHIIRCFDDDNVLHINNKIDPGKDKDEVETELQFKDYETIENRSNDLEKMGDEADILETVFENGKMIKEYSFDEVRGRAKLV